MEGFKKNRKTKQAIWKWGRTGVQVIAFILAPSLFTQAFGGVKAVAETMGTGGVIVISDFLIRFGILCGITFLFGRIFCGWCCAFGAVNDWIYRISVFLQSRLGKKLPKMPESWTLVLQKLKYVVLLAVLICCFYGKSGWITGHSPWTVFSLLVGKNFRPAGYGIAIVLFLLLLMGMAVEERFFCRFFCPMGAIFSLLPELPFTALRRDEKNCIQNCSACRRSCPVGIKLGEDSLQAGECIRCGRCMQVCPRGNIRPGTGSKKKATD